MIVLTSVWATACDREGERIEDRPGDLATVVVGSDRHDHGLARNVHALAVRVVRSDRISCTIGQAARNVQDVNTDRRRRDRRQGHIFRLLVSQIACPQEQLWRTSINVVGNGATSNHRGDCASPAQATASPPISNKGNDLK